MERHESKTQTKENTNNREKLSIETYQYYELLYGNVSGNALCCLTIRKIIRF